MSQIITHKSQVKIVLTWMNGWINERTNEQTNKQTNKQMNEWMNEWMDWTKITSAVDPRISLIALFEIVSTLASPFLHQAS